MEIQIESGIPLSETRGRRAGTAGWRAYPFADLDVGQSFFVPIAESDKQLRNKVTDSAAKAGQATEMKGRKFATRWRTVEQEVSAGAPNRGTGVRIFRIA